MTDYISREAAYPLAKKICDSIDSKDFQRLNFGMRILDLIDDIPAADVREVSRLTAEGKMLLENCPEFVNHLAARIIKRIDELILYRAEMNSTDKENEVVGSAPTSDAREMRKSHWFDGACVYCGFKPALDYEYATVYDKFNGYAWNFCPNCGADMREES